MTNTDPIEPQASDPLDRELDRIFRQLNARNRVVKDNEKLYDDNQLLRAFEENEARSKDSLTALIAQREQAAELRGRIDEMDKTVEIWIHNQHEDDFSDYLQRRKATLQATKPEKGKE